VDFTLVGKAVKAFRGTGIGCSLQTVDSKEPPFMASHSPGIPRLSWPEACARRLERQALATPSPDAEPAQVAAAMCGVHAQVMTAAEWSIGLRLSGATRTGIRAALWTERSLVKTFGPRGTVHLLAARDLPMWTAALSAVPIAPGALGDGVQLTAEQADAVVDAIAATLTGGELTIDQLHDAVLARTGDWAGDEVMPAFGGMWPRWRQALPLAGLRGALCFGPARGRKVTYTSPRSWLPDLRPAEEQAALAEVVRRYLHAYGPATPAQFAQWLAAPRRWAADLFRSLAAELQEVEFAGTQSWLWAGDTATTAATPPGIRLLPYFDAYAVACQPRELLFADQAAERALSRTGQAGTFPVLLVDGAVGGLWHQRLADRKLEVTVEPFDPLTASRRSELDVEVERLGAFLGAVPELTIGAVTIGSHA
jgi:hypothetical protein